MGTIMTRTADRVLGVRWWVLGKGLFQRLGLLVLTCLILVSQACAAPKPKVVMVVIPAVSLRDMTSSNLPTFRGLAEHGCIGLMNSRTAGRINLGFEEFTDGKYAPEAGYMTIGAGARAQAGLDAAQAYNANESILGATARDIYRQSTLIDPGKSEVVHPKIPRLTRDNSTFNYRITVGALGAALHKAGLKTAVIGNSDDGQLHREAVTIAMDSNGLVDYGDVGPDMVVRDPSAPSGYRTNETRLLAEFERCLDLADFIVVDLGDMARLDRARPGMMDDVYAAQRVRVMKRMDHLLGHFLPTRLEPHHVDLIVLSPYPSAYEIEKHDNSLCPVIAFPSEFRGSGRMMVLTSGSTRVDGVITNTDITPSVMEMLGIQQKPALVGRSMERSFLMTRSTARYLTRLTTRIAQQNATNGVLRQAMVAVIVLVAIAMLLWFTVPAGRLRRQLIIPFVLVPPALAPAMMLLSLYATNSQLLTWVGLIGITAGIVGICTLIGRKAINTLMLISLGAAGLFLADTVLGNPLGRFSIMGYSIMEGARYYGLGNELMGALIGSSMVALGLMMRNAGPRPMQVVLAIGLVVVTAVVGAPMLGANMGGAISVIIGFGCALLATSKKPFDVKRAFGIVVALGLCLGAFAYLDSLRGAQHASHLGRALSDIKEGGLGEAGTIITRKLNMNWMLIRVSVWSRLLGAYIASICAVLLPKKAYLRVAPLPLHLRVTLTGTVAGTLAALAFNDSGIVAAATCFVYVWSLVMIMALDAEQRNG